MWQLCVCVLPRTCASRVTPGGQVSRFEICDNGAGERYVAYTVQAMLRLPAAAGDGGDSSGSGGDSSAAAGTTDFAEVREAVAVLPRFLHGLLRRQSEGLRQKLTASCKDSLGDFLRRQS